MTDTGTDGLVDTEGIGCWMDEQDMYRQGDAVNPKLRCDGARTYRVERRELAAVVAAIRGEEPWTRLSAGLVPQKGLGLTGPAPQSGAAM